MTMHKRLKFLRDTSGNVAIIFSLSMVPVFGLSGLAVDTARILNTRSMLQNETDSAALNGAVEGPDGNYGAHVQNLSNRIAGVQGLSANGSWSGTDFTVTASGTVNTALIHVVPGISNTVDVSVRSVARLNQPMLQYEPPYTTWLDPEAGDYNRVYVYCFDPDPGPNNTPPEQRRTKRTPLQDNNGINFIRDYAQYEWPRCEPGETISFELYNLRFSRTNPQRIDHNPANDHQWCQHTPVTGYPNPCRHQHFTDTVYSGSVEVHTGLEFNILETVLCDTLEDCTSHNGPIPTGANRDPVSDTVGCTPGKYMYYGWEDRPPGMPGGTANWTQMGWTDRDYDDIRIIMECPEYDAAAARYVRLIE
ncbi:pilus assembly protein [Glycocaulis profundi]|nr:pilus assembly protein [Glycocaulis profundi]